MIKGSTEEVIGIVCDTSTRYVASYSLHDFYVNVWDLESEEKTVPSFRVNTGLDLKSVKFHKLDKMTQLLIALDNTQVQFYRLAFSQEEKMLKLSGSIKDENGMMAGCEFMGKGQVMIGFDMAHGCVFKSLGYLSEQGKLIKSQVINSKIEFIGKNSKQRTRENVMFNVIVSINRCLIKHQLLILQ